MNRQNDGCIIIVSKETHIPQDGMCLELSKEKYVADAFRGLVVFKLESVLCGIYIFMCAYMYAYMCAMCVNV